MNFGDIPIGGKFKVESYGMGIHSNTLSGMVYEKISKSTAKVIEVYGQYQSRHIGRIDRFNIYNRVKVNPKMSKKEIIRRSSRMKNLNPIAVIVAIATGIILWSKKGQTNTVLPPPILPPMFVTPTEPSVPEEPVFTIPPGETFTIVPTYGQNVQIYTNSYTYHVLSSEYGYIYYYPLPPSAGEHPPYVAPNGIYWEYLGPNVDWFPKRFFGEYLAIEGNMKWWDGKQQVLRNGQWITL